jgi:hypothetical protein
MFPYVFVCIQKPTRSEAIKLTLSDVGYFKKYYEDALEKPMCDVGS